MARTANLAQRTVTRLRNTSQTWLLRGIQLTSSFLGRFSPAAQTRMVRAVQLSVEVHVKSDEDDVSTHAAALTYAAFLSVVPMIVLGLAVTGELLRWNASEGEWFARLIDAVPGLEPLVAAQENALRQSATSLGLIGLVGVLWTASVLSSRATRALAVVFGLPRRSVVNRVRSLGVTIGLGIALFVSLALTGVVLGLQLGGLLSLPTRILSSIALFLLEVAFFTLAYWVLTPRRELRFVDHLAGGILMAIGWNVLKYLGAFFIDRAISRASAVYGTLGAIFGLLLFIRLTMWLFMYGAEVTSIARRTRFEDRHAAPASPVRTARS
jgi:membrane protein